MKKNISAACEERTPGFWISFLFDLQNSLVGYGHTAAMTQKGSEEFSGRFAELKNFFQDLQDSAKE